MEVCNSVCLQESSTVVNKAGTLDLVLVVPSSALTTIEGRMEANRFWSGKEVQDSFFQVDDDGRPGNEGSEGFCGMKVGSLLGSGTVVQVI